MARSYKYKVVIEVVKLSCAGGHFLSRDFSSKKKEK